MEIRGLDPSRFSYFPVVKFPQTKGDPRISRPGDSFHVNSYHVTRVECWDPHPRQLNSEACLVESGPVWEVPSQNRASAPESEESRIRLGPFLESYTVGSFGASFFGRCMNIKQQLWEEAMDISF